MVVVKWCKCLNVKLSIVNPPTPVADMRWIHEHTSIKKCGESKVQGNVVTMELDKMVQTRMVSGWQVWNCFNCNVDICAIDMNNAIAVVNMELQDSDDLTQMQLDPPHVYSECFHVIVDTSAEDVSSATLEKDPHHTENFNLLQKQVDDFIGVEERQMEKRIRAFIKEQNDVLNKLRSRVNTERTIIWKKMCSVATTAPTPTPPAPSNLPSSTAPSASAPSNPPPTTRAHSGSVSRPHSRSVSSATAVAPVSVSGFRVPGSESPASTAAPPLSATAPAVSEVGVTPSPQPTPENHIENATPTKTLKFGSPATSRSRSSSSSPTPNANNNVATSSSRSTTPDRVKWQSAPRPKASIVKKLSSSPQGVFSFDDEDLEEPEDAFESESEDEVPDVTIEEAPPQPPPKTIVDSLHLLGSSVPVPIPTRPTNRPTPSPLAPPTNTTTTTSSSSTFTRARPGGTTPTQISASPQRAAALHLAPAPTTVPMTTVSSTAPTNFYVASRGSPVAPRSQLSSSATQADADRTIVPRQSWRQSYLEEEAEEAENVPVEMAQSFVVPLSLNRRLKSLI